MAATAGGGRPLPAVRQRPASGRRFAWEKPGDRAARGWPRWAAVAGKPAEGRRRGNPDVRRERRGRRRRPAAAADSQRPPTHTPHLPPRLRGAARRASRAPLTSAPRLTSGGWQRCGTYAKSVVEVFLLFIFLKNMLFPTLRSPLKCASWASADETNKKKTPHIFSLRPILQSEGCNVCAYPSRPCWHTYCSSHRQPGSGTCV